MDFNEVINREYVMRIFDNVIGKIQLTDDILLDLMKYLRSKFQKSCLEKKLIYNQLLNKSYFDFDRKMMQLKQIEEDLKKQRDNFKVQFDNVLKEIDSYQYQLMLNETEYRASSMKIYNELNRKIFLETKYLKSRTQTCELEINKLSSKFELVLESNLVNEKALRAKKAKKDDQLLSLIENYNRLIGEKDKEIVENKNEIEKFQREIREFDTMLEEQQELYDKLMKEKELEELLMFEEKIEQLRKRVACRIIGDWWRELRPKKIRKKTPPAKKKKVKGKLKLKKKV